MLCDACYQLIEFFWQEDFAQIFAKNFEQAYFDQIMIMARFQQPLSSLIKSLKYYHHSRAAKFLAQMLYFHLNLDYQKVDLITFVPIHSQKVKKRAYNQSQLIAEELALWAKKPCINCLLKTNNTRAQAQITDKETRLKRLENSFQISDCYRQKLSKQNILLVYYVITNVDNRNSVRRILKKI